MARHVEIRLTVKAYVIRFQHDRLGNYSAEGNPSLEAINRIARGPGDEPVRQSSKEISA